MAEYEYNWLHCPKCDVTRAFEARIGEGDAEYRQVTCPDCGEDLGGIRADLGYQYIGESGNQFSCTARPGMQPSDDT